MSSGGHTYDDSRTRYRSAEEQARGMAAVERLETAWFMDPARVEDLQRLHLVRMRLRAGRVPLGELGWLRARLGEARGF